MAQVERHTDEAAAAGLAALSDDEIDVLLQALTPITRRVLASGEVPPVHGSAFASSEDRTARTTLSP